MAAEKTAEPALDGFQKFRQDYLKHCRDSKEHWDRDGWAKTPFAEFMAAVEASEQAKDNTIYGAFPMYNDIKTMNAAPVEVLARPFTLHQWCKAILADRAGQEDKTNPVLMTFVDPTNRKLVLTCIGSDLLMSYPYRTTSRLRLATPWLDLSQAVRTWTHGFDDYTADPYGPSYNEWRDDASYEAAIDECRRNAWLPRSATAAAAGAAGSSSGGGRVGGGGGSGSDAGKGDAASSSSKGAGRMKKGSKDSDGYKAWKKEQNAAKRARKQARQAGGDAMLDEEWLK